MPSSVSKWSKKIFKRNSSATSSGSSRTTHELALTEAPQSSSQAKPDDPSTVTQLSNIPQPSTQVKFNDTLNASQLSNIPASSIQTEPDDPLNAPQLLGISQSLPKVKPDAPSNVPHQSIEAITPVPGELAQETIKSRAAENLGIAGRFAKSILPKLAGCLNPNPVVVAFNILNIIMDVRKEIEGSQDELHRSLEDTLKLLSIVLATRRNEFNSESVIDRRIEQYKREIEEQLTAISTLNKSLASNIFRQLDYDDYKEQLTDITRKIEGATKMFNTGMAIATAQSVDKVEDRQWVKMFREDMAPSEKASHRFIPSGKSVLRRQICSKGTRVNILKGITQWANSPSDSSPVFWLSGHAGSGKTTIAYTIAKLFEKGQTTILGASFLCSRLYEETRDLQRIVPTIVFGLAQNCRPYHAALHDVDTSNAVRSHEVNEQIEKFLMQPWNERKRQDDLPTFLVVVDALDEIEDTERLTFLYELLESIGANKVTGLKFLVTSRPEPRIKELCKTFPPGMVCRLENVSLEDAKLDVRKYLDNELNDIFQPTQIDELNEQAGGLFIYAATVVKILKGRMLARSEQLRRLESFLSKPSNSSGFDPIDQLYQQIMRNAFSDVEDDSKSFSDRLRILHTFLCSAERISPAVAANLVGTDTDVSNIVLDNLHAVLYIQDGGVHWYHASFPDFIFNHTRSNFHVGDKHFEFSCDPVTQHGILSRACFRIMQSREIGLRFNMGDIKSSYLLDSEHAEELRENVEKNITPTLRYSCVHWVHHLSFSPDADHEHICKVFSDFLRIRVLFWIEVMNLLGKSSDCSYLLQNAKCCVSKMNNSAALAKDLQEVSNFAVHFTGCPAADSTPHLYISSLATWQSTSSLSKSWKDAFFGIPTYKNTKGIIDLPLMTRQIGRSIGSVRFSIDGTQVVAGTKNAIFVLDATTGRQQRVLDVEHCHFVKFSSNGTRLVASSDNMVHIWDTPTYQLLKKFDVGYTTISIEGTQILTIKNSIDTDCQVQVLDVSTDIILSTAKMPLVQNFGLFLSFSSVAKRFLIGYTHSVQIWDISIGCAMKAPTLELITSYISSAAFSPDAKHVVTSSKDGTVRVWDASTGNSLMVLQHKKPVMAFNFSSDGINIACISAEGPLHVWDMTTGAELKVFTPVDAVRSVAFSPDGTRIVSGSGSGIQVWSWDRSAQIDDTQDIKGPSGALRDVIIDVAMTDDSKKIMSATLYKVQIWDAVTGTELKAILSSAIIVSAKISRNGEYIVSCLQDESVVVWDARTGDKIIHLNRAKTNFRTYSSFAPNTVVALSRSGKRFAISRREHRTVEIWNIQTGKEREIDIDNPPFFLSFSTEEQYIVCGSVHGPWDNVSITIYNTLTGDISQEIYTQIARGTFVEPLISTNGKDVIVCSKDRVPTKLADILFDIRDISSGQLLNTVKRSSYGHGSYVEFCLQCVDLSNDGKKLVAGCADGFIRILDVLEGDKITVIGYSERITTVTFSSDDKQVVSGSWDGSVSIWDLDGDREESWTLQETNWITASRGHQRRLMWVSKLLRVSQPRNTLIIPSREHGTVDFKGAMIGEDWGKCYTPHNM